MQNETTRPTIGAIMRARRIALGYTQRDCRRSRRLVR